MLALLLSVATLQAQTPVKGGGKKSKSPEEMAETRLKKFSEKVCGLNAQQEAQIRPIFVDAAKRILEIRTQNPDSPDKDAIKQVRKQSRDKVVPMLTAEQKKCWKQNKQSSKPNQGKGGKKAPEEEEED